MSDLATVPPATPPVCGCGARPTAEDGARAASVDPEVKRAVLNRLRRIEGQLRGLQKMVAEERYCPEVLTQIASVHEALRGAARAVLHNHLRHCATEAIRSGDPARAEAAYAEVLELVYRNTK